MMAILDWLYGPQRESDPYYLLLHDFVRFDALVVPPILGRPDHRLLVLARYQVLKCPLQGYERRSRVKARTERVWAGSTVKLPAYGPGDGQQTTKASQAGTDLSHSVEMN